MLLMANNNAARLSVMVSKATDRALRAFLGAQGQRKGDLSSFIEEAVLWRMLDKDVQAVKARNADIPADELQALIDEALADVRHERPAPKLSSEADPP